jgi:uncharacterized RDD family membrane protein YckC
VDDFAPPARDGRYAAADDLPLASLGQRFVGAMVDLLVVLVVASPLVIASIVAQPEPNGDPPPWVVGVGLVCLLAVFAVTIGQWVMISSQGQSIGKRVTGCRIVKLDGGPVDFVSGVVLRTWVLGFVSGILNQCCLGWIVTLIDALMIVGPERRCLHDHIAGTKVVQA